jgi:hypothetical protein
MTDAVEEFVKPNDRLTSFERLEIYNRQYWFRVLDSFYEDYPGLRAVLGERTFIKMAEASASQLPFADVCQPTEARRNGEEPIDYN